MNGSRKAPIHEEFRRWQANLGRLLAVAENIFFGRGNAVARPGKLGYIPAPIRAAAAKLPSEPPGLSRRDKLAGSPKPSSLNQRNIMLCPISGRCLLLLVCAITSQFSPNPAVAAGNLNLAAHKSRLQLDHPPSDAAQVLDVRKRLLAAKTQADAPKTREVVVTGQIGGMPNIWPETHADYPWYKGQASFFLVDSKVAAQFAAHAKHHGGGEACAFCKSLAAKNAHAIAVVNLVDEQGKILPIDTRELLDLKKNQTVTIRGKAKLLAGSMLVIDADGLFVQR